MRMTNGGGAVSDRTLQKVRTMPETSVGLGHRPNRGSRFREAAGCLVRSPGISRRGRPAGGPDPGKRNAQKGGAQHRPYGWGFQICTAPVGAVLRAALTLGKGTHKRAVHSTAPTIEFPEQDRPAGQSSETQTSPRGFPRGCLRLSKNRVIANQPEGWCGDLPVFAGNPGFLTKKCCYFMGDCHASVITGSQ